MKDLGYTKKEILRMANDSFSDIENFYKLKFLNYKVLRLTREYYNEIVAGIVHDSWEEFRESGVSPEDFILDRIS